MIDLQTALADYAATHEVEINYTLRPSVESFENLPTSDSEASVRRVRATGNYYIYDNGSWQLVLEDTTLEGGFEIATHEEVLEALREGE